MPNKTVLDDRQQNHAAFWRDKDRLVDRYPKGWFVAYSDGGIVADAVSLESLRAQVIAQGRDPVQVLMVQAGIDYPKDVVIF